MRVLVIFSNPPDGNPLRLDREDKLIARIARQFEDSVTVERLHASEIDSIHDLIMGGSFNVVQFSGHGSPDGIFVEKSDLNEGSHHLTAPQLRSLLATAETPPTLAIVLSCYSNDSIQALVDIAPFVITAPGTVEDDACLQFIQAFYRSLFSGTAITQSFENATRYLESKGVSPESFRIDRRELIQRGDSRFIEFKPDLKQDSILVNLDEVANDLGSYGMSEEEVCHHLERKLKIHYWIFSVPRERCLIPIGRLLFGEFTWRDKNDVVYCKRLMRLRSDVPIEHWKVWNRLLVSYNDLASSEHRLAQDPASPGSRRLLTEAVRTFRHNIDIHLEPACIELKELGFADLIPNAEMAIQHCEFAEDHLKTSRYPQVVQSLEAALMNFHAVVDGLRPPEAEPGGDDDS